MSDHFDVVVIGGGQAGLAIGHHLARQGRRFLILEAAGEPAAAWRSRWESLRLFTPARHCGLPGLPFPGDPDRYPTRDEVVDYLTRYARHFDLPVRFHSRVTAVRSAPAGYRVQTDSEVLSADQVVVATGPFQTPRTPVFARSLGSDVRQLHSSDYRSPDQAAVGPVLVVGGGNTGFQIAEELASTHETHLAVGSRQTPLPQRLFGRDIFSYLTAVGLLDITAESRLGRRLRDRETLIGSSPRRARRLGVQLRRRAVDAAGRTVTFADGSSLQPRTVVWATGFGRDYSFLDAAALDADGSPLHRRGVTPLSGLYVLGMPWQHTRGSALLGWVADDAEHIAAHIARHAAAAASSPSSILEVA
jgi:putative flavoprotein involved in K+ transport